MAQNRARAIPDGAERRIKGFLLLCLWQLGDFERMADTDLIFQKCFRDRRN
jgi:hypothetical protein